MPDNPVATAVKPVLYAAAHAVAGPAAALALPLIAAAAVLAQDHLGPIGKAAATVLSALSINLGSTAAGKLAEALDPHSNHDIEILTAAAVQAALQAVRSKNPGPSITTADFDPWFELWHTRLERALKEPADAASLFHSDHPADPVGLALSEREKWWPAFKPLLLRWAAEEKQYRKVTAPDRGVAVPDTSSMPDALDQLLSQQLLDFAQYSQDMLVREDRHKREWIAYQQRFFKEIARRTREQDANVSGAFERLADVLLSELQVLKHSLGQDRQGITVHEKLDELRSLHRRSVDPADPTKVSVAKLPTVNPLLIGREHELKQLDAAWGTPEKPNPNIRLVSIVAYGGVGKTSLALNWWHARACQGAPGAQRVLGGPSTPRAPPRTAKPPPTPSSITPSANGSALTTRRKTPGSAAKSWPGFFARSAPSSSSTAWSPSSSLPAPNTDASRTPAWSRCSRNSPPTAPACACAPRASR